MTAPHASTSKDLAPKVPETQPLESIPKPTRVPASLNPASLASRFGMTAICALLALAGTVRAGVGKGDAEKLSPLERVRARAILEEKLVYVSLDPGMDPASTHKLDAVLNNAKVRAELGKMPTLYGRLSADPDSIAYKVGLDVFDNLFGAPSEIRQVQQVLLYPDGSIAWHDSGDADAQELLRAISRGNKAHLDGQKRRFRLMKLEARRLAKRASKDTRAKMALMTLYRNAPAQAFPALFAELNLEMRFRVLKAVAELPLPQARHLLGTVADHKDLTIRAFVQGLLWALDLQD